jgi:hypothetical protein
MVAAANNCCKVIRLLLKLGASINMQDNLGQTKCIPFVHHIEFAILMHPIEFAILMHHIEFAILMQQILLQLLL